MTIYAQVTANTITATQGRVPVAARRLDTSQWVLGLRDADTTLQEACGWFAVADVTRPADTATERYVRSIDLVGGVATMVWTAVAKTVEEQAAEADTADRQLKGANITPAMIQTLRDWATQADSVTVTQGNAVATLQTLVDRTGVFFDRFADLIEAQRFDS